MNAIGHYFDGQRLAATPAILTRDGPELVVTAANRDHRYDARKLRVTAALGRIPRYVYLPDCGTIETTDPALDALLPPTTSRRLSGLLHWLESRVAVAAGATVLLVATLVLTVTYGLPAAARSVAHQLPPALERQAGETALATLRGFTQPSQLPRDRQADVVRLAEELAQARGLGPVRVEFCYMGGQFPNAFALPGGIIVVTDELVELAGGDGELQAVLAHEIGHLHHRHGLQSVLRGSTALLVMSLVTGDLSTLSTFSVSLPFVLLQRGYSREFEREADDYAIETLHQVGIDGGELIAILQKLEDSRGPAPRDFGYLSTHPLTDERVGTIANDPRSVATGRRQPAPARSAAPVAAISTKHTPTSATTMPPTIIFHSPGGTTRAKYTPLAGEKTENRRLPEVISQKPPVYPPGLRTAGIEGSVLVQFIVDRQGNVVNCEVIESNHPALDAAAVGAVSQWKFRAGTVDGRPVNTRLRVPVYFRLEHEDDTRLPPIATEPLPPLEPAEP